MIQDIHSHTYYSFCGGDRPEEVVEKAIAGGIELFGICDHNYGGGGWVEGEREGVQKSQSGHPCLRLPTTPRPLTSGNME